MVKLVKCAVETCTNNTNKKATECPWLSFHKPPRNKNIQKCWFNAIGKQNMDLTDLRICSDHFRDEDFQLQINNKYRKRLKPEAIPVINHKYNEDAFISDRLCRICLTIDRKMYTMKGSVIGEMYMTLRGCLVSNLEDTLPMQLCWVCAARLTAATKLRERAMLTDQILKDYLMKTPRIKYRDLTMIYEQLDSDVVKSKFVIENSSDSIDGKDSVAGTINSDWQNEFKPKTEKITCQNFDITQVTVKKELDTTLAFDDHDPSSMKTEIDMTLTICNDITSVVQEDININSDLLKNDVDVTTDITSNSDGNEVDEIDTKNRFYFEEIDFRENDVSLINNENTEAIENGKRQVKILTAKLESKKQTRHTKQIDENIFTIRHLSEEEEIQAVVNRQYSERYLKSPYQCTQCYKGFPSEESYERHATKHSEKMGPHICKICKIRSGTKTKARLHMARQHTEEITCKLCSFVTRSRNLVIGHMKYHAGDKYKCQHCDQEFEKQTTYLNHLRLRHMSHYVCDLCGYTFVNLQGVRTHKKIIHRFNKDLVMEGPYCEVCEVRFLSEQAYDTHLNLSSKHVAEDNPNRMSNDRSNHRKLDNFTRKPVRREAIRRRDRNTGPQNTSVSCEQCGEVFPNLRGYVAHFRKSHPGKQRTKYSTQTTPYLCELCGKIFANYTTLRYHMWIHTGQKQYQCDHCKKTFSVKGNLSGHMRLHDKSRRSYDCRICGKQFTSSCNRTRHMFLHTGLKPFRCSACDKCFVTAGELKAHVDFVHLKKPRPKRLRARNRKPDGQAGY
ncbi:zinc finger and SCAN domain-containing protein 12-like [Trichoplusia ni]|uniref:Zinc finger and SCAN domain-containing protein 12-like n=1 Tax=Trichoplusia ni TaxID=7111 RepID=A0A7E5X5T2_TRINI|nr:zinc finger and SCAN domain-containing protein 12-like [Trichoplusia ni]